MQPIKQSQATGDYARMGFTTVSDSDGKTLLNGTLSATARWVDADGTSTAAAGTFSQPDSTNAGGLRYYTPTTGELASKGAAWLYITGTVSGTTFRARQIQINVVGLDFHDAVRAGMTAIPNATPAAVGGLLVRAATSPGGEVWINGSGNVASQVYGMEANVITAASAATDFGTEMAGAIWNALTASYAVANSFGEKVGSLTSGGDATLANQTSILAKLPAALVGGRMDSDVAVVQAGAVTSIVAGVWNALTASYAVANSFGEKVGSLVAAPSAAVIRDTILDTTLDTGRTIRGFFRRKYALAFGRVIGMKGDTVTAYKSDNATPEYSCTQDIAAGSRASAGAE